MSELKDNETSHPPTPKPKKTPSVMMKVITITLLVLAMLIPLGMISGIISERQRAKQQVVDEIAQTWAGEQTIIGPILVVPYQKAVEYTNDKGQIRKEVLLQNIYLLPQQFQVNSHLIPEIRYRGIYQSTVYTSHLSAKGSFDLKTLEENTVPGSKMLWNRAFLVVGIPNPKGITKRPELEAAAKSLELLPGINGAYFIKSGLYAPLALNPTDHKTVPFKLALSLKGSQSFAIAPVGKQNTIQIQSDWTSPSFAGNMLPTNRVVDEKGFRATWEIPYFARNYGQVPAVTAELQAQIQDSSVGVQLLSPVDSYRQSERAVKYGILFLVLTFATYFLFEIISRERLHPFQYLLVGCAISLFYLLLIAASEIITFGWAYTLASLAIISVLTFYSKAILGRIRRYAEWIIAALLTILYVYLYVLLQLEDLSLLFGAIGMLVILAVTMYITRNIDWYNEQAA